MNIMIKKGLFFSFLACATFAVSMGFALTESTGTFRSPKGTDGVFDQNPEVEFRSNRDYDSTGEWDRHDDRDYRRGERYSPNYPRRYRDRPYLQDRYYNNPYQNQNYYYDGGYNSYIPAPSAESYNDITNPYPGDQSSTTNFQNSNFDNQIWDLNN